MSHKPKHYISDIPELMAEWHWEKNNELGLDPSKLTHSCHKNVWWKCSHGHEWCARPQDRLRGYGCPYCSGRRVIVGVTDFATICPQLALEWNFEKNGDLKPTEFSAHSSVRVWWKCSTCGYEWQASIKNRNHRKRPSGCPHCSVCGTSRLEIAILYYLRKYTNETVIHRYNNLGFELDIFIPSRNIGIEYDGHYFHNEATHKDLKKNIQCLNHNIILYRMRECPLQSLNSSSVDICFKNDYSQTTSEAITKLLYLIFNKQFDIDISRDMIDIMQLAPLTQKQNSLANTYPDIAKEWHPIKNGKITPENVTYGSGLKVWWKCSVCGHEWKTDIGHRSNGRGCPKCAQERTKIYLALRHNKSIIL